MITCFFSAVWIIHLSPLGPTLANNFLRHYEVIWLLNCLLECKPSYYKRYVDDTFVLFESETQVESLKNLILKCSSHSKTIVSIF